MKNLFFGLTVFLIIGVEMINCFDQTKFYTSDKNNVYFIEHEQKFDWFESLTKCARMNMTLLTLESDEKTNEVNTLVRTQFGKNVELWVGGYLVGPSRQFTWISNGEPFSYTFWSYSQPDFDDKDEYCAQIGYSYNMKWNDEVCTGKHGYICEYNRWSKNGDQFDKNGNAKYHNITFIF